MTFTIESRWPAWSRWRQVYAKPHGEVLPVDSINRLCFESRVFAEIAAAELQRVNAGEYRILPLVRRA